MIISDCVDYCVYKSVPLIFNISVQLCTVSDYSFYLQYIYIYRCVWLYVHIPEFTMLSNAAEKWPIIRQNYSNIAATEYRILQLTVEKVSFVETSATVIQYLVKKIITIYTLYGAETLRICKIVTWLKSFQLPKWLIGVIQLKVLGPRVILLDLHRRLSIYSWYNNVSLTGMRVNVLNFDWCGDNVAICVWFSMVQGAWY